VVAKRDRERASTRVAMSGAATQIRPGVGAVTRLHEAGSEPAN
jgi:hypothetical protein